MVGLEGEMRARHWLGVGRCSGDEDSESKETLSGGRKASLTVPPSARPRLPVSTGPAHWASLRPHHRQLCHLISRLSALEGP